MVSPFFALRMMRFIFFVFSSALLRSLATTPCFVTSIVPLGVVLLGFEGNEGELWLNGLLALGRAKKGKKQELVLGALTEKMYCTESGDTEAEEEIVRTALLRDGILRECEKKLALCAKPEKNKPFGFITKKQKKQIRGLYSRYRYLVVSFGEEYKNGREEYRKVFKETEDSIGSAQVTDRLKEKFDMFFA